MDAFENKLLINLSFLDSTSFCNNDFQIKNIFFVYDILAL